MLPSASTRRRTRRSGPSAPSRSSAQVRAHAWTTSSRSASAASGSGSQASSRADAAQAIASPASSRARSASPRRRSVWASSVCCWADSSRIRHWSSGRRSAAATCCARIAWATASSSRSRPARVRESQRCACSSARDGPPGVGALGEQARVDGQQHRGVEVVGGDLDVGEVGHRQRGVGGRRALVQRLARGRRRPAAAASGSLSISARRAASALPPGDPAGVGGCRRTPSAVVVEEGEEGGVVLTVAAGEQTPRAQPRGRRRGRRRAGAGVSRIPPVAGWPGRTGRDCRSSEAASPGWSIAPRPARTTLVGCLGRLRRGSLISGPRVPSPKRRSAAPLPPRREPVHPSRAWPRPWVPSVRGTSTRRWSRWRTPSRARCPPRWTGWPTATRW